MAFVPFSDAAEMVVYGKVTGQDVLLTLGSLAGGAPDDDGTMGELAAGTAKWAELELTPELGSQYSFHRATARGLDIQEGVIQVSAPPVAITGGVTAGTANANQNAAVVTFECGRVGRSFRGRNYIPGLRSAQLSDENNVSVIAAATWTLIYAELNSYLQEMNVEFRHCVLSRQHNNNPRLVGVATPVLDYVFVDLGIDSQRRRMPQHGS